MLSSFTHRTLPATVRFGAGTRHELPALMAAAGCGRALVLTTPEQEALGREMLDILAERGAGLFSRARMHTPTGITQDAVDHAGRLGADCVVSAGGGSTTGLGKAISLRTGLPQFVVPTTYAGSEVTSILGETEDGRKVTRRDDAILPRHVIYDPELTRSLPVSVSVTSGVNAIAHAVEALYAPDTTPVVMMMAREATAAMTRALPAIRANPLDDAARAEALYAAWLCGICLGSTAMGLHHKICHVLGGALDLPHAPTHCIVLPHVLAYNREAAPQACAQVAAALGADDAAQGLFDLIVALEGPTALGALGMPHDAIDGIVAQLLASPYTNPAPLEGGRLRLMLDDAWHGRPPRIHGPG